jgi:hypothetical protein
MKQIAPRANETRTRGLKIAKGFGIQMGMKKNDTFQLGSVKMYPKAPPKISSTPRIIRLSFMILLQRVSSLEDDDPHYHNNDDEGK